jgi:hypothetical protein
VVLAERPCGLNRYEIHAVLREKGLEAASPSTIYRIACRHAMTRLTPPMRAEKRRLIKTKVGETGHIDLHQIAKGCVPRPAGQAGPYHQPDRRRSRWSHLIQSVAVISELMNLHSNGGRGWVERKSSRSRASRGAQEPSRLAARHAAESIRPAGVSVDAVLGGDSLNSGFLDRNLNQVGEENHAAPAGEILRSVQEIG